MVLVHASDLAQDSPGGGTVAALDSERQADRLVLAITEAQRSMRAETMIVHGSEGAFAAGESGVFEKAAYPLEVVDTVGAGEAFVAGFLSGRLRGRSAGECLDLANACGACAVTVPGDLKGLPTPEEALALLRGRPGVER